MPIWNRLSSDLVEASLQSNQSPTNEKNWGLRLDNQALTLTTMDDSWFPREKLLIERQGTKILRILVEGVVVYDAGNSTS